MDAPLCETCGERPASRVLTREVDGRKQAVYTCDACMEAASRADAPARTFNQPCERCRKAEGRIKMIRLVQGRRRVSFVCEACARRR